MEEFASRFCIGPDSRNVTRSRVAISRVIKDSIVRRDPRRNISASRPIFSTYGLAWELPFSQDAATLALILGHVCDPGTNRIGDAATLLQTTAQAAMPDGSEWLLERGILRDFQILIEPKQPVALATAWQFGKLTEAAYPGGDLPKTPAGIQAGPGHCSISLGSTPCTTFAGTFAFTRDAEPAGFQLDGTASWFKGNLAMDIVGRMTVRLSNAFPALTGRFIDSLTLTIQVGAASLQITVPKATFQISSRRIVSGSLTDYGMEWAALKEPNQPLAVLDSP